MARSQGDVAAAIRAKLASGELPSAKPLKLWVGNGTGKPCMVCGLSIRAEIFEYEVDIAGPSADRRTTLRFDRACLDVWSKECERLRQG